MQRCSAQRDKVLEKKREYHLCPSARERVCELYQAGRGTLVGIYVAQA